MARVDYGYGILGGLKGGALLVSSRTQRQKQKENEFTFIKLLVNQVFDQMTEIFLEVKLKEIKLRKEEEKKRLNELRALGVEEPESFPRDIQEKILRIGRCLMTEEGKRILEKFKVKRWGWGMIDDDEVLLVIHMEPGKFEEMSRKLEVSGKMAAVIEIGSEFAEALEEAFPHLKDILFSVDAVPDQRDGAHKPD